MRRRGFASLLLVMVALMLMFTWGAAQSGRTRQLKRKIRMTQGARQVVATSRDAAEEGQDWLEKVSRAARGEGPHAAAARALRELRPRQVVELPYEPTWLASGSQGAVTLLEDARARAWLLELDGDPPSEGDCKDAAAGGPPLPPARARGLVELEATARTDMLGVRMRGRTAIRRQFSLTMPACPETAPEGFTARIDLNPVILAETIRVWREEEGAAS